MEAQALRGAVGYFRGIYGRVGKKMQGVSSQVLM